MNQKLIDLIKEIKQLALDTEGELTEDDENLDRIFEICERIELDHKMNKQLERLNERH